MERQFQAAMAKLDATYAQRQEEARQDMLLRLDADTVAGLMETAAKMWRTERQVIETRIRGALEDLWV
jgi:hypothetical protein